MSGSHRPRSAYIPRKHPTGNVVLEALIRKGHPLQILCESFSGKLAPPHRFLPSRILSQFTNLPSVLFPTSSHPTAFGTTVIPAPDSQELSPGKFS
jgi:hypothetical protein